MPGSFTKKDAGYVRVQDEESDEPLLDTMDNPAVTGDQATFDFRGPNNTNGDTMTTVVMPGPQPSTSHVGAINSTVTDYSHPSRQISLTTSLYGQTETEENLKCVVSSILFFAIIIVLIVVAFVFNPPV